MLGKILLILGAGLCLVVVVLLAIAAIPTRANRSREEVASYIEAFLEGTGGDWDWDDFTSVRIKDPELEAIRKRCRFLDQEFPPAEAGQYCGPEGLAVLREYARNLRHGAA